MVFKNALLVMLALLMAACIQSNESDQTSKTLNSPPLNISLDFKTALNNGIDIETVTIKIIQNETVIEEKEVTINAGIAQANFDNLLAGEYSIEANAYIGNNLVATGSGDAIISAGKNTTVDLSLTFLTGTLSINVAYALPDEASFRLTFMSTWSETTHPTNFPVGAHFSGLIGATHNKHVDFWEPGQLASAGIQSMAETGSKTLLISEIESARMNGNVNAVLSAGGIGVSPGEVTFDFTAHKDFPLFSLVSMLAPSPDWFVGTDSLELIENNQWIKSKTLTLAVYDAGTDDGAEFSSANAVTNPQQKIELLTSLSTDFENGIPEIGFFILERLE